MHIGHYISGTGHLALIVWMFVGGWFRSEPEPFEMTEVSVITGAEFEAILAAQRAPENVTEVAQPATPEATPDAPEVTSEPDSEIVQPTPLSTEVPAEDTAPAEIAPTPTPTVPVEDTPPTLDQPTGDTAVLVPEVAPEAVPRPVDRVAPEPVAQPDPEARVEPDQQEAVAPDAEGPSVDQEPQEATAPEEATTEIVTEATQAPAASKRPPGQRPSRPQRQAATQSEDPPAATEQESDPAAAAIAAAVAEAQAETPVPSGPPLSAGEKDSLRVAVSSCWNVGSLSSEALQTTVVVSVSMNRDGTPVVPSITMEASSGGSATAARQAFEAARRAIIRCGSKGYDLPETKYGQWQNIEMTFNPERMRIK